MRHDYVRFVRNQDVVSRQIEGELIILPVRRGVGDLNSLYTLNPVGSVLWEFMAEEHSLPEMAQRICDEFEVNATKASNDILSFLDCAAAPKNVKGRPPVAAGQSRFLYVAVGTAATLTTIGIIKAVESPSRP